MKVKNKFLGLFFFLCLLLAGCSKDDEEQTEVYPPRFAAASYEVRLKQREAISFVDGSGDYTLHIENPELLEASYNADLKLLFLTSKQKGETTLTITDNKAKGVVSLKIKVTDSYLCFVCMDSNIPGFTRGTDLFLVDNPGKDFYLFYQEKGSVYPVGDPILQGQYKTLTENNRPFLVLTYQYGKKDMETHKFDLSGSNSELYTIMNNYLNSGWGKSSQPEYKSISNAYYLKLYEASSGYRAQWRVDVMVMPAGILK